jgi:hypothetical protein
MINKMIDSMAAARVNIFMRHNSLKQKIVIFTASIAFLAGCSSAQTNGKATVKTSLPQPNLQVVTRTLQSYQAGKTTMEEFIRDAHLIYTTLPKPAPSYLDSKLFSIPEEARNDYETPTDSPWKIYESSVEQTSTKTSYTYKGNNSSSSYAQKFVVGDTNKPICILTFDGQGKLTNISPLPLVLFQAH